MSVITVNSYEFASRSWGCFLLSRLAALACDLVRMAALLAGIIALMCISPI